MIERESISKGQLIGMTALFIAGTAIIAGGGNLPAKQDDWIAMLAALLVLIPLVLIYSRISTIYKNKNLFEIIFQLFGNILGWIFSFLMVLYSINLGILSMKFFIEFIQVSSMFNTPQIVMAIAFGFLCWWAVYKGVGTLGRLSVLFVIFVSAVVLLSTLMLIKNMDINNLKPILGSEPKDIISSAQSMFAFPFAESVLILVVLGDLKKGKSKYSSLLWGVIIGGLLFMIILLRNTLTLGGDIVSLLYFPSYTAVSTINIGNFFQRAESIIASNVVISTFTKLTVCVYASSKGCEKLFFSKNYKVFVLPIVFIIVIVSPYIFPNTMAIYSWIYIYRYYALFFQVIIPLVIWITAEIKNKKIRFE